MKYLLLAPCLIYIAIGVPLILKMVPPNHTTGYRTARTLGDEVVWYAVNTNVGWGLVAAGVISAVAMFFIFQMDLGLSARSLLSVAVLAFVSIVPIVVGTLS